MALMKRSKKRLHSSESHINITALMDILTVLLFFLIKSYAMTSSVLTPSSSIELPHSTEDSPAIDTITVSLNQRELKVNDRPILALSKGFFPPEALGADRRTIKILKDVLVADLEKRNSIYRDAGDPNFRPPGEVLVQADKKLTFGVLKYLFHTITTSGYTSYQFVVINDSPEPQTKH